MQAIILAAGTGSRLHPLTHNTPKATVRVGGKEIILHQLEAIAQQIPSITEVIVVVGYQKQCIRDLIGNSFRGIPITYVDNEGFASTNNVYSLYLAMPYVRENVLLMECDVIFRHEILANIAQLTNENRVFVEKFQPYMDGCVVEIEEDTRRISRIIPKRDQKNKFDYSNVYKTVNIYHLSYDFVTNIYHPALDLFIKRYGKRDYYELVIGSLVYMNVCDLYAEVIEERKMLWFEIDDLADLRIAELHFGNMKKLEDFQKKFGGYWDSGILDFCYLSNPYFPPHSFVEDIKERAADLIGSYPSGSAQLRFLTSALIIHPISQEHLFIANGASEFLRILAAYFLDSFTIPTPTFDEYLSFQRECNVNKFQLMEMNGFQIDIKALIREASKTNHLVLINPNNPTGSVLDKETVRSLLWNLRHLRGIVLDESFIDFSDAASCTDLVDQFQNLIVIKSISKSYGVPGLRLGYLYTRNAEAMRILNKHLPIWNINAFAERFLEQFSKHRSAYRSSLDQIKQERAWLTRALTNVRGIHTYPSQANFLLCRIDSNEISAHVLTETLLRQNCIFIKDLSKKMDGQFIRIGIRKHTDNQQLVECLKVHLGSTSTIASHNEQRAASLAHETV